MILGLESIGPGLGPLLDPRTAQLTPIDPMLTLHLCVVHLTPNWFDIPPRFPRFCFVSISLSLSLSLYGTRLIDVYFSCCPSFFLLLLIRSFLCYGVEWHRDTPSGTFEYDWQSERIGNKRRTEEKLPRRTDRSGQRPVKYSSGNGTHQPFFISVIVHLVHFYLNSLWLDVADIGSRLSFDLSLMALFLCVK